ncbi:uncharacterized protein LOC100880336 isoform X1 [Megachile rotundata]|uniref:uncharacterized protein LOC100880336 isoform X1 n=1 Tax=Megachile rotundata TaxID=143995 RepID=UPI003FD53B02
MIKLHQSILKRLRSNIVADIDVYNGIIQPLKSEYILKPQDIAQIEAGISKQEKAEILLDILPNRGPNAFSIFREALQHHYEWLSDDLGKMEESGKAVSDVRHIATPTLPPISPLSVVREEKMMQLKTHLEQLQPNQYVVLHGMKGFGKSCLTASTLKDTKFVKNVFNNEVYWIKFGYERSVDEEILIQLNRLYHLVKNIEMLPGSLKPEPLRDSLIHYLKYHFSKEKHALLILDDVCYPKIIDVFDFDCKTLVITADLDVVYEKRPFVIKMNDGFTETETLGLFAKVLETEIDKLPPEAKQIHEECKGMPLLIAMFSAQFEEFKHDMNLRTDRWKYYLNSLRNKDEKNKVIKKFLEKQEAIFNMCINQLPPEMRKRYEELVIFREDVNITPQILEVLWEGSPFQVEEMMLDFCHKSLAAKQWNDELRSYIYGVHDLLLCHLRKKISNDEFVQMHKSLIDKYRRYCKDDFSKLPADNYSYSYLGYHLEQAKLYDEFPEIYLNLNFIQATIIHSGLSNLLIDLDNYEKYITKDHDTEYESRFIDLKKFLEEQASTIAEHRRKRCLDIVQIAMNHSYDGYIKDTAIKLARERSKYLYVFHDKKLEQKDIPLSEEMSTEIHTSCFACDPDLILIGCRGGEIFLWNSIYKRQEVFRGHDKTSCIKKIVVSTTADCFLSLDDRGIVKLFRLSDDDNYEQSQIGPLSPKQKQVFWSGIFTSKVPHDDSSMIFNITDEIILDVTFTHDSNYIAACTNKGTITVWDRCGKILANYSHNPHSNSYFKRIAFTIGSNLLHIMDEVHGALISYCKYGDEYKYLSQYNLDLQKRKVIFFRDVPKQNDSLFIVTEDKAIHVRWCRASNSHMHSYNKQIRANVENGKTVYVCAAITNDGQYLVLADSDGFINVWNTNAAYQLLATYKSRVSSLDTYWLKEEGYHIICGSENRLLHKWKFPVEGTSKVTRKFLFDAVFQDHPGSVDTLVVETVSNTIAILVDDDIKAETKPFDGRLNNLFISPNGQNIVCVNDKGIVNLFDVATAEGRAVLNLSSNIELIKILDLENGSVLVCRGTDDNLRVWENTKVSYLVESAGYVISIHKVHERCVLTVTRNGIITLWNVNGTNWLRICKVTINNLDIETICSCLSYQKNFLAVLNNNGEVAVYKLQEDTITLPTCIKVTEYFRKNYNKRLTCCEISENENYLAVGFENGDISVIDMIMQDEIRILRFHTTSVSQLRWAPSLIGVPILLSVNSDELVWWNITLALYVSKPKRGIWRGINRSISTPTVTDSSKVSSHISTSQSADSNIFDTIKCQPEDNSNGIQDLSKFWKSKEGKDHMQPALLAVVELPSNFLAKVCISTDFTKFVTVDIYGSVSTFTLCGYN